MWIGVPIGGAGTGLRIDSLCRSGGGPLRTRRNHAIERRAVLARQVGYKTAVDAEQHLGGRRAHMKEEPFRALSGAETKGRAGVSRLVRTTAPKLQQAQQGIPNAPGDVVGVQRLAIACAEHV